ncbi:MAG: S-layer homology domain-containing protein [Thermaerobacter sp.]|nr:S-layer homology domain-containing protein [Thermaerobacter sp.]
MAPRLRNYLVTTLAALLTTLAVGVLALPSASASSGPGVAGQVKYYNANYGGNFYRSPSTIEASAYGIEQSINPDGSIQLTAGPYSQYTDSGFSIYHGTLSDLKSLLVTGSGPFRLNIWLDANNDGDFFDWSQTVSGSTYMTGLGNDVYLLGNSAPTGGVLVVNGSTSFDLQGVSSPPGGKYTYTLAQLQAGDLSSIGVTSTTDVAVWIGINGTTTGSQAAAKIDSVQFGPPSTVGVTTDCASAGDGAVVTVDSNDFYCGYNAFPTIQGGLDAVASGGTVDVAAGTYAEQLTINKALTLTGAGKDQTTIVLPSTPLTVTSQLGSYAPQKTVYGIAVTAPASDVTISNLTVDGNSAANGVDGCSIDRLAGIAFQDASGTVSSVDLPNWAPQSGVGCGSGVGVQVEASSGNIAQVTVENTVVKNYGKSGIFAGGPGTELTATDDTVKTSPTAGVATNGIEVDYGASGTLSGNTVSGNDYTGTVNASDPQADYATGVLLYGDGTSSVTVSGNTLTDNQIGVETVATNAEVSGNSISQTGSGIANSIGVYSVPCDTYCTDVGVTTGGVSQVTITDNQITGIPWSYSNGSNPTVVSAGIWLGNTPQASATGSITATVSGNTVSGGYFGVMVAPNESGATATIENNQVSSFERTGIDAGSFALGGDGVKATITGNTVSGAGSGNTDDWAQNGIEIANGATGSITDNHVTGMIYTGKDTEATGIIVFESSGVQVSGNTLQDNQLGIALETAGYSADHTNWAMAGDVLEHNTIGFDANYQSPGKLSGESAGTWGIWTASYNGAASVQATIEGNVLNGANATTGGVPATGIQVGDTGAGGAAGNVSATISGNSVTGWSHGIEDVGTTGSGATFYSVAHYNDLSGNTVAGLANLTGSASGTIPVTGLDANHNWWGTASGPKSAANTYNVTSQGVPVSGDVTFVPWLSSAPAAGATTGQDFAPVNDTTSGAMFSSIQAAVDVATPGDRITVAPGTFSEAVSVGQTVALEGAQQGVDARSRSGAESIVDGGFAIHASDVTIDGFTIQDAVETSPTYGVGVNIYADTSGANIVNDVVQDNVFGLYLGSAGTDQTVIQHDVFKDNNVSGPASGDGIYADQAVSNALIDSNVFAGNNSNGLVFVGSGTGNATSSEHDITISGNEMSGSTAIALMGAANVTVKDNVVQDTGSQPNTDAIYLGGGDYGVTLTHNVVQNSTGWAVSLGNIVNHPSADVTLQYNSLEGSNRLGGLNVDSDGYTGGKVDATDNWWGSKNGPTGATKGAIDASPFIQALAISPPMVRSEVGSPLQWTASIVDENGNAITDSAFAATFAASGSAACQNQSPTTAQPFTTATVGFGCTPTTTGDLTVTGTVSLDGTSTTLVGTAKVAAVAPPASPSGGGVGSGSIGNQSSTITENGTTTTFNVNADLLTQNLNGQTGSDVTFSSSTTTSDVNISADALQSLTQGNIGISIQTPEATYTLPSGSIDVNSLETLLGVSQPSDISLSITMTPASAADTADITNGVPNGSIVGAPVTFTVTATANGQTQTIEVFSGAVPRSFTLQTTPDPTDTTGIVIVNGLPEHAWTVFSGTTATINSHTDSTYAVVTNQVTFNDITGLPQANAINALANKLIIAGITPTAFDPQGSVTRAQFAALVIRALGLWNLGTTVQFRDVSSTSWAAPEIRSAVAESFIKGFPDSTFRPQVQITNAQMATIVARVMRYLDIVKGQTVVTPSDQASIPAWASQDVALVLSQGIMTTGSGGAFNPDATTTRAQAAQIIWNLMQKAGIE